MQQLIPSLEAVAEGAQIILGPVFAQEANAAGVAVAGQGVNGLAFSNKRQWALAIANKVAGSRAAISSGSVFSKYAQTKALCRPAAGPTCFIV